MAATQAIGADRPDRGAHAGVRPVVWAALSLMVGIALYRMVSAFPSLWLALAAAAIVAGTILHRRRRAGISCGCIALAIASAGIAAAQLRAFTFPSDHIAQYTAGSPRLACVRLRIAEPPMTVQSSMSWMLPPRQMCNCQAVAVLGQSGWRSASGTVRLSLAEAAPHLAAGQTVLAVGMLGRPAGPMNPGQFDEADELRQQGILAELEVRHASAVQVLREGRAPILPALRQRAASLLLAGFAGHQSVDGALLEALVLGHRPSSLHNLESDFSAAGVMHLLASNGARIAVLAMCIYLLGRLLGAHPRRIVIAAAGGAAVYGCLLSATPQAIRPLLLCVAVCAGLASRRWVEPVQLLAGAAITLLIAQPLDLFSAGFELSFVTVLGLMLLSEPARRAWLAAEDPDERVLASFGRLSPVRIAWQTTRRRMMALMAMGAIAWAAALPLVAYHFRQINPYSVPMGLLLSPVAFVCLLAGAMKLLLTAAVPGLAGTWAGLAGPPLELLRHAVHAAARLPGSDLPMPTPGWGWLLVWYGGLLACALPRKAWLAGRQKWLTMAVRFGSPATGALLMVAPLAGMGGNHATDRPMRITLLAVGAGQCAVIEAPDGRASLIDAGSNSMPQMMREVLEPFLRYQGRRRVARLVLSGSAADRTSAAGDVLVDCGEPAIFVSAMASRGVGKNWQYAELLDHLDQQGSPAMAMHAGQTIDLGDGATLSAVWPADKPWVAGADAGLVLKLQYAGRTMLFPGDISESAERALLQMPAAISADVLVAPRQGTCDGATADLIHAADPAIVLSSDSPNLTEKQLRLAESAAHRPILRTGQCGAITIEIHGDGSMNIVPFLPRPVDSDGTFGGDRGRESFAIPAGHRRIETNRNGSDHQ